MLTVMSHCWQALPDDTSTELDPRFRIAYLAPGDAAARPRYASEMEEAIAAAQSFAALESAAAGVPHTQNGAVAGNADGDSDKNYTGRSSWQRTSARAASFPCEQLLHGLSHGIVTRCYLEHGAGCGPGRPYLARMLTNHRITAASHFQDVRHIEFELEPGSLAYEPGDLLAVLPQQPPAVVRQLLLRLGLDPQAVVRIQLAEAAASNGTPPPSAEVCFHVVAAAGQLL